MQILLKKQEITEKAEQYFIKLVPLIWQIIGCGIGFIGANAPMFGNLHPLGIAFCCACPKQIIYLTCLGASLNYFLQGKFLEFMPYIITIIIVMCLRKYKKEWHGLLTCVIGSCLYLFTSFSFIVALEADLSILLYNLAEAFLICGIGYGLHLYFANRWQGFYSMQSGAKTALVMVSMIIVIMFAPYKLWYIHPVVIVAGLITLIAACRGKESLGAVFGIACGIAIICSQPQLIYASISVASGGLIVGLLVPQHRFSAAIAYILSGLLGLLVTTNLPDAVLLITELFFTSALFLALPPELFLSSVAKNATVAQNAMSAQLTNKLSSLSNSLENVGRTVNEVCNKLPKQNESYEDVCINVAEGVCKKCQRCILCWVTKYDETMRCLQSLQGHLVKNTVNIATLPSELSTRCAQPMVLASAINAEYASFVARRQAKERADVLRTALTEQYSVLATTLSRLAQEVGQGEIPDSTRSKEVQKLLKQEGFLPLETLVMRNINDTNTASVQIKFASANISKEELLPLQSEICAICKLSLSKPKITEEEAITIVQYFPKCRYSAEFGVASYPAKQNVCADATRCFITPEGTAYSILCDGMGTGKEAAIDGNLCANFTSQLLKSGFNCVESARLVNVALGLKSDEDASAGVDIIGVNLYTGKAQIFKAGGAPSFFVRRGKVSCQNSEGLPIGILGGVSGRGGTFTLLENDTVVFVSDGVAEDGNEKWIAKILHEQSKADVQKIANEIAKTAKEQNEKPDDITVIVMRVVNAM